MRTIEYDLHICVRECHNEPFEEKVIEFLDRQDLDGEVEFDSDVLDYHAPCVIVDDAPDEFVWAEQIVLAIRGIAGKPLAISIFGEEIARKPVTLYLEEK